MRSTTLKSILKTATLTMAGLLLAASASFAQSVSLTAAQATATLPDGSTVPMWGYSCTAMTLPATCAALNPNAAGGWSPIVITVPPGSLSITLTNSLPSPVPTSLVMVGQLGGGLGTTATSTASPDHTNAQANVTWPIVSTGGGLGAPPIQGTRVQSFSTEVTSATSSPALVWPNLKPGTYLIESGTHPSIQGPMGLYGILVVTTAPAGGLAGMAYPAVGANPAVAYNADVPLLLSEIDPVQNKAVAKAVTLTGFSETAVWSGLPGGCGNPATANSGNCYPPAVNYSPLYYLFNGVAFDKTNPGSSLFSVTPSAPAVGGPVLVRLVNAGLRMHVPSIVGSQTGTSTAGFSLIAEDGNPLPGVPRVQSEVFMAAGKTYDVMINAPAVGGTALPIFDRQLSLSSNAINRDGGMLAYIGMNGAGIASSPVSALAKADSYNSVLPCAAVPCNALIVSDFSKGLLANDINVFGAQLSTTMTTPAPTANADGTFALANGTLALNANGTFTYTPKTNWSGNPVDTFTYCGNGATSGSACALVTLGAAPIELAGITINNKTFKSNVATSLSIKSPGILGSDGTAPADHDAAGYPLTVATSTVIPSAGLTLSVDKSGAFNASVTGTGSVACPTGAIAGSSCWNFTYQAQNSQGTVSSGTPANVTLVFPPPTKLIVTVLDGQDKTTAITDYRWIIEEDRTFFIDPNCTTNPPAATCPSSASGIVPTFGTNFHTSYMPVVAAGCIGPTGAIMACETGQTLLGVPAVCDIGNGVCRTDASQQTPVNPGQVYLDPHKRYYFTVFPGDAANSFENLGGCLGNATPSCGHGMGGAPIAAGQTAITVYTQPNPFPPSKLSVFVFEDDFPLNGEQDGGGGVDTLSPNEPGLGGFNITLFDDAGGTGDATGQMTYDMFNQPLSNSLAGTIDPASGKNACPISVSELVGVDSSNGNSFGAASPTGITGTIVTCPKYESDGTTLSPLAGQAVVANLMPGRYGVVATPAADRIAAGEEWLQTNTLDGQKAHDSFLRIGEPSFFQEFGPAGYHVSIGFANPKIINSRLAGVCGGTDPTITGNCTPGNTVTGTVTTERMSRTPDERLFSSGDNSSFAFTQCYVSFGDPDGEDFAFTKCDANGSFSLSGLPDGDWRITVFDQWNDMLVDGLSTPVRLAGGATISFDGGTGTGHFPMLATNQWQANIYTKTFFDQNGNGIQDSNESGLTLVATNIRFRDGSYSNFNNTDLSGNAGFNEEFPLFSWYVVETDSTRYKNTGVHVVYDAGGPSDGSNCGGSTGIVCNNSVIGHFLANTAEQIPVPTNLRVPGAYYCANADCTDAPAPFFGSAGAGGSTGRIDPAWVATEGWQGFSGQNSFMEFGKKPFAAATATTPAETGGIHGEVIYASTRPFDDPTLLIHTSWTPDVPGVTINLYQEGTAPDGSVSLKLVDTTKTTSWDDWAQGFRTDNIPNMNCPGQGTASGTNADLFFFSLFNQPMWLDAYNNGGTPAHTIPNNSQFKCYDGMHNWNQIQPAPYDGMYTFPSVIALNPTTGKPAGTNCHISTTTEPWGCISNPDTTDTYRVGTPMLPAGKYVVEMIVPPGYELVKEEDKNILIGDNYIAPVTQQFGALGNISILPDQAQVANLFNANNAQNPTQTFGRTSLPSNEGDTGSVETFWPCVGASRIVPDYMSIFPQSKEVAPFAGATRNLCDRKEVTLSEQASALAKFWIFTSAHVAAHFTGVITDDFTSEFDPFSPQFGEKFAPPNLPISIKDWSGTEISRVYSDHWGTYDGLTYSSWEVNPPNPTGYAPTMMVVCMNDPGTGPAPDPLYNPQYSQFCYEIPFMPGQTQYMDTPVTPTSAFAGAGYNNPDCAYPADTPAIKEVDGDGSGPWVSAAGKTITITALGYVNVPNNAYSGPSATTLPYNQKTILRHFGFGTSGTVTIGGVPAAVVGSWTDALLTVTVPAGVPNCTIQQQSEYAPGATSTQCGELVITNADSGRTSIDTVTVTIGGKAPTHVLASASIQSAIDAAKPGDLIIVDPTCTTTTGPVDCTTAGATHSNSTHNELLLMWKPVQLQGVGAASSIINANTHPAGKMDAWRLRVNCLFGLTPGGAPNGGDTTCGTGWANFGPTSNNPQIDRLPLEATVGWDATLNGNLAELLQEPTLMGALEGAAITVLSKGVNFPSNPFAADTFPTGTTLLTASDCASNPNPFPSNFFCNPSSIDGLGITDSSQGGGGVFVHAWGHKIQIANNRIYNNSGTLTGGISIGQGEFPPSYLVGGIIADPGSCQTGSVTNTQLPYCFNLNVNVHNNAVTSNSSTGDELFSATPAGAGGVSFCNGSDYYKFNFNWVCGNLSTGDGGGLGHIGFSYNGDIEHNTFLFNQSTNPTIPTNGGGILVMGAPDVDPPCSTVDQDCLSAPNAIGPSDGTGPGLVINANLIMGNAADSGSGGGIRLQAVNGSEVINFPRNPENWYSVNVTNNIISNNVAGWDGAGVSLMDALVVNIVNNTIMSNDTTASSGVLFDTFGAPLASSGGTNCIQGAGGATRSCPQPSGLVSIQNSAVLAANLPSQVTCPPGHGTNNNNFTNGQCKHYSVPTIENDIFWQNRAFYIGVGSLGAGTLNQQHVVALFNAFTTTRAASQPITGACVTGSRFWDIGVRGDTSSTNHTGGNLTGSVRWSDLTSLAGGYGGGGTNTSVNPDAVSQYCNGSRVPPELGSMGYQVPPGISDATVPNPIFNLTPAATVDEGNNWINISWGPLSMSNAVTGAQLGNYALVSSSPAIDYIFCNTVPCLATGELIAAPTSDFFGNPRPDPTVPNRIDVGAVEFQHTPTVPLPPVLISIAPSTGLRGSVVPVVLTGSSLIGTTAVTVTGGGIGVAITSVNSNTVTANFTISTTAALTARNVTITTPIGTSNAVTFTVQAPTLTSIAPNMGVRGNTGATGVQVTLTGTNLSGATALTGLTGGVSLAAGTFHVVSATTVAATLNITTTATLGIRNIGLATTNGATNTVIFTVQGATVASIAPFTGVRGTTVAVTITGTNLTGATAVTVAGGGVTAAITGTPTSTTVTANFTITNGAALSTRNVNVVTPIGTATLPAAFTVIGGTAAFAAPTPVLTTAPANTTTKAGTVTVSNTATGPTAGPLTLTAAPTVVKVGTTGGTFSIIAGGTCASGTVIAPGGNCTIVVQYAPGTSTATATAHVTITDTGAATASQNGTNFNGN